MVSKTIMPSEGDGLGSTPNWATISVRYLSSEVLLRCLQYVKDVERAMMAHMDLEGSALSLAQSLSLGQIGLQSLDRRQASQLLESIYMYALSAKQSSCMQGHQLALYVIDAIVWQSRMDGARSTASTVETSKGNVDVQTYARASSCSQRWSSCLAWTLEQSALSKSILNTIKSLSRYMTCTGARRCLLRRSLSIVERHLAAASRHSCVISLTLGICLTRSTTRSARESLSKSLLSRRASRQAGMQHGMAKKCSSGHLTKKTSAKSQTSRRQTTRWSH